MIKNTKFIIMIDGIIVGCDNSVVLSWGMSLFLGTLNYMLM